MMIALVNNTELLKCTLNTHFKHPMIITWHGQCWLTNIGLESPIILYSHNFAAYFHTDVILREHTFTKSYSYDIESKHQYKKAKFLFCNPGVIYEYHSFISACNIQQFVLIIISNKAKLFDNSNPAEFRSIMMHQWLNLGFGVILHL